MKQVGQVFGMRRCLLGFLGITLIGMLLHNAYAWTRPFPLFALIAPVNESVWEHLKMAFWSVLLYGALESLVRGRSPTNLLYSLAIAGTSFVLIILLVFYGYTSIAGKSILWADISIFVAGAFVSRWLMCRIQQAEKVPETLRVASLVYLVALALVFVLFTYHPPGAELFRDHSLSEVELIHGV